jgi:hypothetical protein
MDKHQHLKYVLEQNFTPEGQPSASLKTSIAHFKDRFKEVGKAASVFLGTSPKNARPKVETLTNSDGSMIRLTLEWDTPFKPDAALFEKAVKRSRIITPTMINKSQFDWNYGGDHDTLPGWKGQVRGEVSCVFEPGSPKSSLTAQMLFHHPQDSTALSNPSAHFPPAETFDLQDGGKVVFWAPNQQILFRIQSAGYWLGKGTIKVEVKRGRIEDDLTNVWLMHEACGNPRATSGGLITLAKRLFGKGAVEFYSQENPAGKAIGDLADEVMDGLAGVLFSDPRLKGGKLKADKAGSRRGEVGITFDGASLKVLPWLNLNLTTHFSREAGFLSFFGEAQSYTVDTSIWLPMIDTDLELGDPTAAKKLIQFWTPVIKEGVNAFFAQAIKKKAVADRNSRYWEEP